MADSTKKYVIQQKLADGMLTLHPETEAGITKYDNTTVTTLDATKDATDVQTAIEALDAAVKAAVGGAVTDVKVKLIEDGGAESVVTDHVATIDLSGKQDVIDASNTLSADFIVDGTTNHVFTAEDDTKLGGIAEGATKVEASETNGNIKVNGEEVQVYEAADEVVYSIVKDTTSSDYAAVYHLTKKVGTGEAENVGEAINIAKDLVVKSGSIVEKEGKKYIELVLNDENEDKIYIAVEDLVDVYTEGNGITISEDNEIAIDEEVVATLDTGLSAEGEDTDKIVKVTLGGKISEPTLAVTVDGSKLTAENATYLKGTGDDDKLGYTDVNAVIETVGDDTAGLVKDVADLQDKFDGAVTAGTYSVVQVTNGIVTGAGNLIEVGAEPTDALVTGGIFFKEIA